MFFSAGLEERRRLFGEVVRNEKMGRKMRAKGSMSVRKKKGLGEGK